MSIGAVEGHCSRIAAKSREDFNGSAHPAQKPLISRPVFGAPGWDRTSNPCLRRAVLYPLSYGRIGERPCVREAPKDKRLLQGPTNPREYLFSVTSSIARGWTHRAKHHTIRVN